MEAQENKRGQKLYYYLSRLKEKEVRDFHDYLLSPLLGNSPQFARMLLIIQDKVLRTDRTTIDADLFQEEFFPGETLDAKKTKYIRIRLVQFQDKVLEFASFMDYRSDRNARDIHMLKAMRTRGWEKYFEKVHEEVEARPPVKKNGEHLIYQLWKVMVLNEFVIERSTIGENAKIALALERMDQLYFHLKLKHACAVKNALIHVGKTLPILLMKDVMEHVTQTLRNEITETQGYYHSYLMLDALETGHDEGNIHFEKTKHLLKHSSNFDSSELIDVFYFAINYSVGKIRAGHNSFRKDLTELYDIILQKGVLLEAGMISKGFYKNLIINACRYGEIEWAETFAEEWKDRIAGDENHLSYFGNKAHISLHKKEYDKVIELLYNRIHKYEDVLYGMAGRIDFCRALWGKEDYQWLMSTLGAMRQFIIRFPGLKKERSGYEKFIYYLSRMCLAKTGNPDQTQKKLVIINREMIEKKDNLRMPWVYSSLTSELDKYS